MKIYRGVIENNKDPLFQGRYQVRIFGLSDGENSGFNTSNTDELPWAECMGSTAFGNIGGVGVSSVLHQGTWVYVILQDDDPNLPIILGTVIGSAKKDQDGFGDPDKKFPIEEGNDLIIAGDRYNFLQTIKTQSGHLIEIDDFEGDERIKITHKTGTYIYIDKDGTINVYGIKDLNYEIAENMTMKIGKNSTIDIGENASLTIGKNSTIDIGENSQIDVGKSTSLTTGEQLTVESKSTSMTSSGSTSIKAKGCTIDSPNTNITGNMSVGGNASISGTSTASDNISGGISGKSHTHGVINHSKTTPPN